jgi:hypothetical protein
MKHWHLKDKCGQLGLAFEYYIQAWEMRERSKTEMLDVFQLEVVECEEEGKGHGGMEIPEDFI